MADALDVSRLLTDSEAEAIHAAMLERGMTQAYLAEKLHLSTSSVSYQLSRQRPVPVSRLEQIWATINELPIIAPGRGRTRACRLCRHFCSPELLQSERKSSALPSRGECRANPPTIMFCSEPYKDYGTAWPDVDAFQWCGAFTEVRHG